jgi:hypothetical protein
MKQKESVQGSKEAQQVIKKLRIDLEEARRIKETLEYQNQFLEANKTAKKKEAEMRENILIDDLKEIADDLTSSRKNLIKTKEDSKKK